MEKRLKGLKKGSHAGVGPYYQARLWNGVYYNFDASGRERASETIMADALAGIWYLDAAGGDDGKGVSSLLDPERVRSGDDGNITSCFQTVFVLVI
eukprot:126499-Prorocentrum_minimum.AAC.1